MANLNNKGGSVDTEIADSKIESLILKREMQEKDNWFKRGFIRIIEIAGYLGVFLCTTPVWYTFFVCLTAFSLALDFVFQYTEWIQFNNFQKLLT